MINVLMRTIMKLPINSTYIINAIEFDKDAGEAQVYINDTSTYEDYIANYEIFGDLQLHYDMCGNGEREVSLQDTEILFVGIVDYLNLEEVTLPHLDINKVTSLLEEHIIEVLEQERIDDLHSDYIGY